MATDMMNFRDLVEKARRCRPSSRNANDPDQSVNSRSEGKAFRLADFSSDLPIDNSRRNGARGRIRTDTPRGGGF